MAWFIGVVVGFLMFVALTTGQYISGRILLPEVGLSAPGWWIWFASDFFLLLFLTPIYWIKEAMK